MDFIGLNNKGYFGIDNVVLMVNTVKPVYNDTAYNDKPVYNDNCFSPVNKGCIDIQPVYSDNLRITICFKVRTVSL